LRSENIKKILEAVSNGKLTADEALKKLGGISYEDIEFAKLDHSRSLRTGMPEVVFAPGKTDEQIIRIFEKMAKAGADVLITRVDKKVFAKIKRINKQAQYNELARAIFLRKGKKSSSDGKIAVVSAGTSDIPVAEEAAITAEVFGANVDRIYDVGVAGIHRLLSHSEQLRQAKVIIVAAGMEGALASVVGGLVAAPVVAVPTSVGYGASFGGVAALLAMLNSCAPGVTVVNIDNGFGAAMAALKMIKVNQEK
jgi:pyridinium-3,5-biscarboxylic acid mononucleotide synthase